MPKRVVFASILLVAVAALVLWGDRFTARRNSRAATPREDLALPAEANAPAASAPGTAAKLFGRVVEDATDRPVSGASVTACAFGSGASLETRTAEDGSFQFPGAIGGVFHLVARHERGTASVRGAPSAQPIVIRVPSGGAIRGRVLSAATRAPVSPCRVSVFRCSTEEEPWDPHADLLQQVLPQGLVLDPTVCAAPDGSFEVGRLRPGPYVVFVAAEEFAPGSLGGWNDRERVRVRADAVTEVEIVLPATAAFVVEVSDEETGDALDGARFEAILYAGRWSTLVAAPATILDDGVYELRSGYGERGFQATAVRISREGYAARAVSFAGQKAGYRFPVSLGRGGAILGHVRVRNEPARGALVIVERTDAGSVVASAATGPDGAFAIELLPAGEELAVHVYDRALDPIAVVPLMLESGEERVLEIGGLVTAIEGRVVLRGVPEANATVRVSGASYSDSPATGRDGSYCVEGLRAGRHEVEVFADDAWFQRFVDLANGQRLRLDIDASAVITGVVVDAATGAPLSDAATAELEVHAIPVGAEGTNSADVLDDARFRLPVEPGIYELDVPQSEEFYAVERPRIDVTRPHDEVGPVTLRVRRDPRNGRIAFSIKDAVTGEPVPEGDYDYETKNTWGSGGFEHGTLEEWPLSLGAHTYRIWSEAHAPTRVEITLSPDRRVVEQIVALRPAEATRIDEIRRGSAGWIAGLRTGDVIRVVNGRPTTSIASIRAALTMAPGPVAIEFDRGGERRVATLSANKIDAELENIVLGG